MADFYAQMTGGAAKIPVRTPDEKKIEWVHGLIDRMIEKPRGKHWTLTYPITFITLKAMSLTSKQLEILCEEGFDACDTHTSKREDYDTKCQTVRWNHIGKICKNCPKATLGKAYEFCNECICNVDRCPYQAATRYGSCTNHRG